MKFYFTLTFLFIINCASAQIIISGKVIDEKTKQGISGVSVYLNNSTFGGQTDTAGRFLFKATLIGKTTLIISHLAYERKVYSLEDKNVESLLFSLKPQTNVLNEVVIKSKKYSKADLTKWITLFSLNLIGTYKGAGHSTRLTNKEALYFDFDNSNNNLHVFAKAPLIVENDFLNYKITIDLERFEYNFNTNEVLFKYFAFYEDSPRKVLTTSQIQKNRIYAYEGSAMHFMRSVFKNNLEAQWFDVYQYDAELNKEKSRIEKIIRQKKAEAYVKYNTPDLTLNGLFSGDTLKYYKDVLNQATVIKSEFSPVAVSKFITKDKQTRTINFNFPDTLTVTYDVNKLNREKKIAAMMGKNKDRTDIPQPIYLYTYMYFFKPEGINIRSNGYYPELSLFMWGDMAERRIAMSLPYDFDITSP
ncbi:carboxypeptidase-like regulatory domain-containing protein [Pedobacter sp. Du54]|uniref:carboxypeptidase-like regulatory domain-containing protein n=1 Tax=Pedobacter anseongensis TaxID=3133439 RepID=UPI00309A77D4